MEHSKTSQSEGIALVIVLSFLILISVIILAFFSSVSTELTNSKAVANSASTHQLADSAVNVVMAQIVDATKGQDSNNGNATLAWASQPGMIRTFDTSGKAGTFFKLYSSDQMTVPGTDFKADTETPAADWSKADNAGLYTDLNQPVLTADPAGLIQPDSTKPDKYSAVYPIVDPFAEGIVDGFKLTKRPGFINDNLPKTDYNPARATLPDFSANPAPMPVKWLYVLKDGALKPASNPSNKGNVDVDGATAANPIVGRIAFWADDETAKVNINTASEGTYWDVPRIYSSEDFGQYSSNTNGFSTSQPVQHEFQRYPGHPATTCLSPVFKALMPVAFPYPTNPQSKDSTSLDYYYNIAPRIGKASGAGGGGSQGGSIAGNATTVLLTTDTDRLYASIDELMFTPTLTTPTAGKPPQRIPNTGTDAAPGKITKGVLEKAKFFITANSTAPETTLNNTPRVAVWPVALAGTQRTAYDSLLAFCSTIGGKEYYFTRTPRTGARSTIADYTGRNVDLYKYLQALTGKPEPGFGGDFLTKYGVGLNAGVSERDQILTYIYDYIRSTNLQDSTAGANSSYTPAYSTFGAGEVVPIRIDQTQGFGRFLSISSANVLFYGTKADATGKITAMRALFFLQFASPGQGQAAMRAATKYTVTGLDTFQAKIGSATVGLNLPPGGTNRMSRPDMNIWGGRDVGGAETASQAIWKSNPDGTPWPDTVAGKDSKATGFYPFFSSADIPITAGQTTFSFPSTVDVTVKIDSDEDAGAASTPIQTIHLKFPNVPDGTFKVPGIVSGTSYNFGQRPFSGQGGAVGWVDPKDTIVALQVGGSDTNANANTSGPASDATAGDARMVESLIEVPAERFRAHNDYKTVGFQYAHGLTLSTGELLSPNGLLIPKAGTFGVLAAKANYLQTTGIWRQPDVPNRVPAATGVTRKDGGPGDWDTGFGDQRDGAHINKPDEGDTAVTDTAGNAHRLPYMLGYAQGAAAATPTYFSPNRQIPSPLMFGSIPTGVQHMQPWQTLLFNPHPEDLNHPGFGTPQKPSPGQGYTKPPDHLIADLFWMPVVEPYAISQPFATAGKINMNYQIMPFTYINRSTGMYAVMKATKFMALPVSDSTTYKPRDQSGNTPTNQNRRRSIDMDKTLAGFNDKFNIDREIFKSASQICEMNLVPTASTTQGDTNAADYKTATMATFWNNNKLTGDNLREKPYVDLYSRLTTKSNTYTVHVRVQALKKAPSTNPIDATKWDASKDKVVGEYRGSSILERYIDVNDPDLLDPNNDFAKTPTTNIDKFYKMRVVSTKRFAP